MRGKQWLGNALLLLVSSVALFGQDTNGLRLSGRVTDSTGAGLASAELEIVNYDGNSKERIMVTSAADGRYEATIATAGFYVITAKREGFAVQTTDAVEVRGGTSGVTLNITMLPSTAATSITVSAGKAEILDASREVSTISLSPEQLKPIPSLGEQDIFRAFQLLPGVTGSNETSAGIAVRGGRADQTFVRYDGFRAYGADHLFGYFSAFNTDALQKMELSKGGFEAKKGGVLSGFVRPDRKGGAIGSTGIHPGRQPVKCPRSVSNTDCHR